MYEQHLSGSTSLPPCTFLMWQVLKTILSRLLRRPKRFPVPIDMEGDVSHYREEENHIFSSRRTGSWHFCHSFWSPEGPKIPIVMSVWLKFLPSPCKNELQCKYRSWEGLFIALQRTASHVVLRTLRGHPRSIVEFGSEILGFISKVAPGWPN